MQRPDPPAFWQYLRTLEHPALRAGEKSRDGARHLAPSRLDRSRLALRQMGTPADQQSLAHKELVFLQHKRRAMRCIRQREWGDVPYEIARALVECRRNRSDTGFHVPRLWDLWPLPLQQLGQDWYEVYFDEFPEVSGSFERPRDLRWDTLYTVFTKHWLTHPSLYMKTALGLPDIPASASPLPVHPNPAEQLEFAIRALGGGIYREPSLERPLSSRKRTPAEAPVIPHPEPVRRGSGSPQGGTCLRPSCKSKSWP